MLWRNFQGQHPTDLNKWSCHPKEFAALDSMERTLLPSSSRSGDKIDTTSMSFGYGLFVKAVSHSSTTMSFSGHRKSEDTISNSSTPSTTSDNQENSLEVAFEKVENALNNQFVHLRSLEAAVNQPDHEETTLYTSISQRPVPTMLSSSFAKLSRREKLWKEGRRDLYRFIENFEEKLNAHIFQQMHALEARSLHGESPKLPQIVHKDDSKSMIAPIEFERPRTAPNTTERYGKSGCYAPASIPRARTTSPPARPEPAPTAPPLPERNPSRKWSDIHPSNGGIRLSGTAVDYVPNLLPEEHIARAKAKERESSEFPRRDESIKQPPPLSLPPPRININHLHQTTWIPRPHQHTNNNTATGAPAATNTNTTARSESRGRAGEESLGKRIKNLWRSGKGFGVEKTRQGGSLKIHRIANI